MHSRKASKNTIVEPDTIALTSPGSMKDNRYSINSDGPWSPTVAYGKASTQKIVTVQRGSPVLSIV
jgi:hypothetical protein